LKEKYNRPLKFIIASIVPRLLYRTKLEKGVNQKIRYAKRELKNNPNLNWMVEQNHYRIDDPLFSGYVARRIDPRGTRHVFALVSASHTVETENNKKNEKVGMNKLAQKCGVETLPVIQAYQRGNLDYGYTNEQVVKNYRSMMERIRELKKTEKSLGCIIAPEGHRSEDGILGKGESGVVNIAKNLRPIMVIPVATYSDEKLERDKINFGKRINLDIGDIKIYDENSKNMNIDEFMKDLAVALPLKMRGQYSE